MVEDGYLFWNLRRHGAPLVVSGSPGMELGLEETLAYGLDLSRRSPTVAQTWPVVLAKHRDEVDLSTLESMACRLGQGQTLGFFLTVLGKLLSDTSFRAVEHRLRYQKPKAMRYFFELGQDAMYRKLTRMRTPEVAKEWGFWMNTTLDDFWSCLRKFVPTHETVH